MKSQISSSIMCADFLNLKDCLSELQRSGADYLHIDIMDGKFVSNYTLGTDFVKTMKENCSIPLDIHLMVERPERSLDWFCFGEGDYVSVHYESTCHLQRVLSAIRAKGAKAMVALNPATPDFMIENVLDDIDGVLIMTVNPGFAGQKLVKSTLKKIKDLREYLDSKGYANIEIEVDGNVSFENAKIMREMGANIFVGGTSSVFSKENPVAENIEKLRGIID